MEDLAGRIAIVTGGASGMGRSSSLSLARAGVHVVVADLNGEGAETVAAEARGLGSDAIALTCDVGAADAFEVLRRQVFDRYGKVDIVMNNAGVFTSGRPEDFPIAEWERVLNINFMSIVRSTQIFLPHFLERGEGHFVNTASFAGLFTFGPDLLPYAASKAAVVQMSEGLAYYLRPKGIGVTCLCPGSIMTNIANGAKMWSKGFDLYGPGEEFELMSPDPVGEMVVDAIRRNIFMLQTHPNVREKLVRRAQDFDAFLDHQIAHPQAFKVS